MDATQDLPPERETPSAADSAHLARLMTWLETNAETLLDDPINNLIGIGIGKKSGGPLDDDSPYCITGFVEKKLTREQITELGIAPFAQATKVLSSGRRTDATDITIDVVETGSPFVAHPGLTVPSALRGVYGGPAPAIDLQKRFGVLRSGVGITNPHRAYPKTLSVGTLGFFVRDGRGRTYLVSNNHVIAAENAGRKGDAIVQPGTLDLTASELSLMGTLKKLTAQTGIATLSAWVDLRFPTAKAIPFNTVDCAAAELTDSGRDLTEIARIGLGGDVAGVAAPFAVDPIDGRVAGSTRVYKAGRTTGWTEGDVTQIAVVADVRYGPGLARFRNQIGIAASADNTGPFSEPGDSGSGILDRHHHLVGLLFAGNQTRTLANPIQAVLTELEIALGAGRLTVVTT